MISCGMEARLCTKMLKRFWSRRDETVTRWLLTRWVGWNNIGDEGAKAIGGVVNTSLTMIYLVVIILVMKGKGNRRGIESEYLVDYD